MTTEEMNHLRQIGVSESLIQLMHRYPMEEKCCACGKGANE